MVSKCANSWYPTTRPHNEGNFFRLDMAGKDERKTEYIWLCAPCVQMMHPKVEVTGDTVTLRLTKNLARVVDSNVLLPRVN